MEVGVTTFVRITESDVGAGLDFSWAWQARGLNYNLVISIMVCLFVGRVVVRLSRRCAGFHAPAGVLS
jgi:ribose 1,5-bisphosphokinase PhnN